MVRVKICGLTDTLAIETAIDAGADAIGLVLSPSPRRVAGAQARRLFDALEGVERVAVLAHPGPEERALLAALRWDAVQVEATSAAATPLPAGAYLLPSFRDGPEVEHALLCYRQDSPDPVPQGAAGSLRGALLLDGPRGGGRGQPVDPRRARRLAALPGLRLVLAGGLCPDSVGALVRAVRPFAVDVSSGVESAPGRKDPARVRAFIAAVRAVQDHSVSLDTQPS